MAQRRNHAQRRAREGLKAEYAERVSQEKEKFLVAQWEARSDEMLRKQNIKGRMKKKELQRKATLDCRRRMLAALLKQEDIDLQCELKDSFETMEQRRERMVAQATRLQQEREKQRLEQVRLLREQQWKDSVDEIRTHKSKLITARIAEERLDQLKAATVTQDADMEREKHFARQWEQKRLKMYERELNEAKVRSKRNTEMRQMLDIQVQEQEVLQAREVTELFEETEEVQNRWKKDQTAEEAWQKARRDRAAQIERDVQAYNKHKRGVEDVRKEHERNDDAKLLNLALAKEAQQMKEEADLKEAQRQEMIEYQGALKEQMIKEVEDNSYLEFLLKQESDKEWKKREDKWAAEEAARQNLMKEVDQSRQQQLTAKVDRRQQSMDKDRMWADKSRKDLYEAEEKERRKAEERKTARLRNKDFVLAQVDETKSRRQAEIEKELQKLKLEKEAEQVYQKKFNALFQEEVSGQDFRRKKVQWYY